MATKTGKSEQREIRVFISSTFRDMQEEREELVKQIFPQLRRLCESRGVAWGEVDLRWGVPDEAKAEGKVLPLCLAEIERCRPYFIGLLGERYGWVPEEIPPELLEAHPWLNEHRKQSVTALEILHGVLRNRQAEPFSTSHSAHGLLHLADSTAEICLAFSGEHFFAVSSMFFRKSDPKSRISCTSESVSEPACAAASLRSSRGTDSASPQSARSLMIAKSVFPHVRFGRRLRRTGIDSR
jgi:hypothetical protein